MAANLWAFKQSYHFIFILLGKYSGTSYEFKWSFRWNATKFNWFKPKTNTIMYTTLGIHVMVCTIVILGKSPKCSLKLYLKCSKTFVAIWWG